MKINLFKKVFTLSALIAGFSLSFTSCSSDEEAGANISPKEALMNYASNEEVQMVFSIRLGDLIKKSGVQDDLLPAEVKMMANTYMDQFLNSEETGLDLDAPAYVLGNLKGIPANPEMIAILFSVTNAETFGAFLEGQIRMSPEEGEGFKYIAIPGGKGILAWNNSMAMVLAGKKIEGDAKGGLEEVMKAMSSKGKNSTKEIAKFADKKADLGFFMDYEKYTDIMPGLDKTSAEMFDVKVLKNMMKGATLTGYVNFEKGKITAEYDMSGNSELTSFMKKAYRNGNPEFANYLGGENLIGFMTGSINVDEILNFYEKMGFFEMPAIAKGMEEFKNKTGLSIREMANKFSGDFSLGFVGIAEDNDEEADRALEEENPYSGYYEARTNTKPIITFAIGVRDSLLSKAFDTIAEITKKGNAYHFDKDGGLAFKNGILFLTSDIAILDDFALDGRLNTYSKNNVADKIKASSMYGYFDFNTLATALKDINPEAADAVSIMDYAEMTVDKNICIKVTLYMKSKTENSLKLISKMIVDSATKGGGLNL